MNYHLARNPSGWHRFPIPRETVLNASINAQRISGAPAFPYIVGAGQRGHGGGGGVLMRAGDGHGGVGALRRRRVSLRLFRGHRRLRLQRRPLWRVNCAEPEKKVWKKEEEAVFIYYESMRTSCQLQWSSSPHLKQALVHREVDESRDVASWERAVPLSLWSVRASSLPPHFLMIHSRYLITSSVSRIILPKVLRGRFAGVHKHRQINICNESISLFTMV